MPRGACRPFFVGSPFPNEADALVKFSRQFSWQFGTGLLRRRGLLVGARAQRTWSLRRRLPEDVLEGC